MARYRGESSQRGSSDGSAQPAPSSRFVRLVDALPDIASTVPVEDRALAESLLVVPRVEGRDEDLAAAMAPTARDVFDFVVIEGVVLKETTLIGSRPALELLGPGDILAPALTAVHQLESRAVSRYLAHGAVGLAALDLRFRQATHRWPGLTDVLHDRLGRQTHRASMHLAMLHMPRVEDRVVALFTDLAERFGRITSSGIVIDLPLTHELLGQLVGSRRPTISLALQSLAADGVLSRRDDRWLLSRDAIMW